MTTEIHKGETYRWTIRPETASLVYVPISTISLTAPVQIGTTGAHGMPDGWRFAVTGAKGLTQLNAAVDQETFLPADSDYFQGVVVDPNTIKIDHVNATQFPAYTSGGVLQYFLPMNLNACSIRAQIRTKTRAATLMLDLTPYATMSIPLCRFDFSVPAAITSAVVGDEGVLGVEIIDGSGSVLTLPNEDIVFLKEMARE